MCSEEFLRPFFLQDAQYESAVDILCDLFDQPDVRHNYELNTQVFQEINLYSEKIGNKDHRRLIQAQAKLNYGMYNRYEHPKEKLSKP